jgi:hypothetical protein
MNGLVWFQLMSSGVVLVLGLTLLAIFSNTRVQWWCGRIAAGIGLAMVVLILVMIWGGVQR